MTSTSRGQGPAVRKKRRKKPRSGEKGSLSPTDRGLVAASFGQARRLLGLAAAGMLVGVALVATGETTVGPWVSLISMALGIGAAHTLGRCGPDPGLRA